MKEKQSTFRKGSYIYIEGDEDADQVFIVIQGRIHFNNRNKNIKITHRDAGPGEIFGFISSLSSKPRMESAIAAEDTTVVALPSSSFLANLHGNPDLAFKVLNYFADFLRQYDDLIFADNGKEDLLPLETRLHKTGLYYYQESEYQISLYILNRLLQLFPSCQYVDSGRAMILEMENTGTRSILEPIHQGIYNVYADNQAIFCEDEPGEELFIIKEGKVKIVKYQQNTEIMLSVLKEGDIFGELAIVSSKPRNATAISFGKSVLLPINKDALAKLIQKSPPILKRIFTALSQRLWFTHIRLDSKVYRQAVTRFYAFLENKLIEENIPIQSEETYTFKFGIDELLKMNGASQARDGRAVEELLKDSNFKFNFGQIIITKPSILRQKAQYYRSRDGLYDDHEAYAPHQSQGIPENDEILSELDNFEDI